MALRISSSLSGKFLEEADHLRTQDPEVLLKLALEISFQTQMRIDQDHLRFRYLLAKEEVKVVRESEHTSKKLDSKESGLTLL